MRILLIIAALVTILAAPFQAQASGDDGARDAGAYAVATPAKAHTGTGHCPHVPCDGGCAAVQHAPCACGVFAHFGNPNGQVAMVARVHDRIAISNETRSGLSLLPPVPPPL